MKNWVKAVLGAGAGMLALWLLSRKGVPPGEQPTPAQAEITSIVYEAV